MADPKYPVAVFAGLVEAATAAADQEVYWANGIPGGTSDIHHQFEQYGDDVHPEEGYESSRNGQYSSGPPSPKNGTDPSSGIDPSTRKRKRTAEKIKSGRDQYVEQGVQDDHISRPRTSSNTRSIGLPSAAALYRLPPSPHIRYTRPPMSRVYASLELSAENFLQLQATAKAYMLDNNHPERRECVGQRGRGDTDVVRLKLWNCVREFLDDRGYGERFFGENVASVEGQPARTSVWPRDAEKIIKSCVPLLRRMVTNEKQRQYAVVTRRSGTDQPEMKQRETGSVSWPSSLNFARLWNLSRADLLKIDLPDLLNEDCQLGKLEAADLFENHVKNGGFHDLLSSLHLSEKDCRILTANIDSHLRIFHDGNTISCDKSCETRAIDRLLRWDSLHFPNSSDKIQYIRDHQFRTIQELFNFVKEDMISSSHEEKSKGSAHSDGTTINGLKTTSVTKPVGMVQTKRSVEQHNAIPTAAIPSMNSSGPLKLHINLVSGGVSTTSPSSASSTRRIVSPFILPSASVPNLAVLRNEIKEHYILSKSRPLGHHLPNSMLSNYPTLDDVPLKVNVWLPDGLVRVKDDGEWMVALMSAEMVEWMDKEVKILVEAELDA